MDPQHLRPLRFILSQQELYLYKKDEKKKVGNKEGIGERRREQRERRGRDKLVENRQI